jgi:methanogenic corrinoid protein MtbC1
MSTQQFPTTTNSMQQIQKLFELHANVALAKSIDLLNAKSLYETALKRIVKGEDLTSELPQLKNLTKVQALQVLNNLIEQAVMAVKKAWVLDTRYANLFASTVRIKNEKNALFEQYDVEHKAENEKGTVIIAIVTSGRTATVTLSGQEQAIELLSKQLVIAGLR